LPEESRQARRRRDLADKLVTVFEPINPPPRDQVAHVWMLPLAKLTYCTDIGRNQGRGLTRRHKKRMGKKVALVCAISGSAAGGGGIALLESSAPGPGIAVWPANPVAPAQRARSAGFGNATAGTPHGCALGETNEKRAYRTRTRVPRCARVNRWSSAGECDQANSRPRTEDRHRREKEFLRKNSWHPAAFRARRTLTGWCLSWTTSSLVHEAGNLPPAI